MQYIDINITLEQLVENILNSTSLEEAQVYAKLIKQGIQIEYLPAKMTKIPQYKIEMIKEVRNALKLGDLTLGLKEAKDFVEGAYTLKIEKKVFMDLERKAINWGGRLEDVTPNSIKFIKE